MKARLNPFTAAPAMMKAMLAFSEAVSASPLEHSLMELVKMRASQINGCAFCLDMHARDAIKAGERPERLYLLDAWRESPLYSDRERAALAWTEVLTTVATSHAPDAVYDELARHFSPQEQVELTVAIGTINAWNRINVGFQTIHPVARAAA
jgi:AhpD family alkylhydroperoxidase